MVAGMQRIIENLYLMVQSEDEEKKMDFAVLLGNMYIVCILN